MKENNSDDMVSEKVIGVAVRTLNIPQEELDLETGVGDHPQWDSVGHLSLLHAIESEFSVVLNMDDMLEIETLEDIVEILKVKTGSGEFS